jgi:hypothetical protein
MRDGTDPNATADSARAQFDNYVDQQWKTCTCSGLARALHATQDSFARGHAGFQPWSGGLVSLSHFYHDAYPSDAERADAVAASAALIRKYKQGCKSQCPK